MVWAIDPAFWSFVAEDRRFPGCHGRHDEGAFSDRRAVAAMARLHLASVVVVCVVWSEDLVIILLLLGFFVLLLISII